MKTFTKILLTLMFAAFGLMVYAASYTGWGVHGLNDPKTRTTIAQNCPDYYRNQDGDCLRRTFRSYYLVYGIRGGGFSGGK